MSFKDRIQGSAKEAIFTKQERVSDSEELARTVYSPSLWLNVRMVLRALTNPLRVEVSKNGVIVSTENVRNQSEMKDILSLYKVDTVFIPPTVGSHERMDYSSIGNPPGLLPFKFARPGILIAPAQAIYVLHCDFNMDNGVFDVIMTKCIQLAKRMPDWINLVLSEKYQNSQAFSSKYETGILWKKDKVPPMEIASITAGLFCKQIQSSMKPSNRGYTYPDFGNDIADSLHTSVVLTYVDRKDPVLAAIMFNKHAAALVSQRDAKLIRCGYWFMALATKLAELTGSLAQLDFSSFSQ